MTGKHVVIAASQRDADIWTQENLGMPAYRFVVLAPHTQWHVLAGLKIEAVHWTDHPEAYVSEEVDRELNHCMRIQNTDWEKLRRRGRDAVAEHKSRQAIRKGKR